METSYYVRLVVDNFQSYWYIYVFFGGVLLYKVKSVVLSKKDGDNDIKNIKGGSDWNMN
jgi:hypothetical protein